MLGGNRAFEGHAVGLRDLVAVTVLDEVETLLFLERRLEILGAAEKPGLALLAHPALEHRLDEHRAVPLDQRLDLFLAGVGTEHFGCGKAGELQ